MDSFNVKKEEFLYGEHSDASAEARDHNRLICESYELVPEQIDCFFVSVYKGEWKFQFTHYGITFNVCGGNATYEDAYHLKLENPMKLNKLLLDGD